MLRWHRWSRGWMRSREPSISSLVVIIVITKKSSWHPVLWLWRGSPRQVPHDDHLTQREHEDRAHGVHEATHV